jgi:hypothetical protein
VLAKFGGGGGEMDCGNGKSTCSSHILWAFSSIACAVLLYDEILVRFAVRLLWWWLLTIKMERAEVHNGKLTREKMS